MMDNLGANCIRFFFFAHMVFFAVGQITQEVTPGIIIEAYPHGIDQVTETAHAGSEAYISDSAKEASKYATDAEKATLETVKLSLRGRSMLREATRLADRAIVEANLADEAVVETRKIAEEVAPVAKAAALQAVKDVVADEEERIRKEEVEPVLGQRDQMEKDAYKKAKEAAKLEAAPFQNARIKAEQDGLQYVRAAQEQATASSALKGIAVQEALSASKLQAHGQVIPAQEVMVRAHDIIDKSLQMQDLANTLQSQAGQINSSMGAFDLAGQQASAYAATRANPVGKFPPKPSLPKFLRISNDEARENTSK